MVDRAARRRAGRHDEVAGAGAQGELERCRGVGDVPAGRDGEPQRGQPRRQERAESVAEPTVPGGTGAEQLVAEHEHVDTRPPHVDGVVAGRGEQADGSGCQRRAGREHDVAGPALAARAADVPTENGDAVPAVRTDDGPAGEAPGLAPQHAVRSRWTTAPVAMLTASPAASAGGTDPASTSPTSRHGGGPATAQPSIALVSAAGRSVSARASAARTAPAALSRPTRRAGTGPHTPDATSRARSHEVGRPVTARATSGAAAG